MIRLALGFVLAMGVFAGAAIWTVRQIEPVVRIGAPLAQVRTVELAPPPPAAPPPPREAPPRPSEPEPETVALAPQAGFVESPAHGDESEPAAPPAPVVVAAEPTADESAALIRRMLSVYRRAAAPDRSVP